MDRDRQLWASNSRRAACSLGAREGATARSNEAGSGNSPKGGTFSARENLSLGWALRAGQATEGSTLKLTGHHSEADLQAEFYSIIKRIGLGCYLEVKLPSSLHRSGYMRVDVAVTVRKFWRQSRAYAEISAKERIPVFHLTHYEQLHRLARKIEKLPEEFPAPELEAPEMAHLKSILEE